jgi:hypothetical protein
MPHIADYKLADGRTIPSAVDDDPVEVAPDSDVARRPFRLPVWRIAGGLKRLWATTALHTFTLPQGIVPEEAAVFGYVAHPQGVPAHLNYSIDVNGTVITPEGFGNKTRRALLQIIPGNVLRSGANEITLLVDVKDDHGDVPDVIEFSDLVLWFQRDV